MREDKRKEEEIKVLNPRKNHCTLESRTKVAFPCDILNSKLPLKFSWNSLWRLCFLFIIIYFLCLFQFGSVSQHTTAKQNAPGSGSIWKHIWNKDLTQVLHKLNITSWKVFLENLDTTTSYLGRIFERNRLWVLYFWLAILDAW